MIVSSLPPAHPPPPLFFFNIQSDIWNYLDFLFKKKFEVG